MGGGIRGAGDNRTGLTVGVEGRYQPKKRRKRGTIDTEGGFIGSYESLRASVPAPLMYSNAKCVRPGPPLAFGRWGGGVGGRL